MEKIKNNLPTIIMLIMIVGCMFILNISTLLSPDDYSYALLIGGDDLKITSFSELFNASKYLYTMWTGRIIPHLLVGFFMTTTITLFKIINSLMFGILLLIITRFITHKNTLLSIITALGFFVYGTMFGEKFAWISGSLNYLWTAVFLMLYLYFFYGYFIENMKLSSWQKITLALSGFIVGFLHEVTAFLGGAFLGIIFITNIKKVWKSENKNDKIFFVASIILFAIGCMLTIFAPGNFARSEVDPTQKGGIFACLGNYKDIKIQLLIMVVSMITIGILKQKELLKKELLYFILPIIIATLPFAYLGYFTPRSFASYECIIIIITTTNLQFIVEHFKDYKKTWIAISSLVTIVVFIRFLPSVYSAGRYLLPYKLKMTKQLETAQREGLKDVVVSKFLFTDKIYREKMINVDNFFIDTHSNTVANTYMALYYKFDTIHAISDIDYFIEIETDITDIVDYGIIDKDTLELIFVVQGSDKISFAIPKDKLGTYVIDCRDKDLRGHVKNVRIRAVGEELENPDLEVLINQAK